jgi:nucleotide-binding universal stress UspA family protein
MYGKILLTLDASRTDRAVIDHIKPLAKMMNSRVVLLHVADGWAARTYGPDAISREIDEDKAYLAKVRSEFESQGTVTEAELLFGDPAKEIVRWVKSRGCDLVAMSTHGHRGLADLFLGTTASHVRHHISVPVLLVRAQSSRAKAHA